MPFGNVVERLCVIASEILDRNSAPYQHFALHSSIFDFFELLTLHESNRLLTGPQILVPHFER